MADKKLIVIAGPTAVGKTALCVRLAKHLHTEVVSADSRQFYKQMAIGTAKPTTDELDDVKHHFINSHDITNELNAGKFEQEAIPLLENLFKTYDQVILTGGSGLYIKAITDGMDEFPDIDPKIRTALNSRLEKEGIEKLQQELSNLDPVHFNRMDRQNSQRVVRALEVCIGTGKPFSSYLNLEPKKRPWKTIKVGLNREREMLYDRINQRVDQMISQGLVAEVRSLIEFRNIYAMQTVGYKELLNYLDDEISLEEAIALLKQNTRRFAKRQVTWFKKEKFTWFEPGEFENILKFINA